MSSDARAGGQSDAFGELLRGSLWPTLVAAVVCVVVGLFSSPMAAWVVPISKVRTLNRQGSHAAAMATETNGVHEVVKS